jgi:ATP-dependent DNA ligase
LIAQLVGASFPDVIPCARALQLLPYAFDLLMLNGDNLRRRPFAERKAALCKALQRTRRTSGMSRTEGRFGDATAMRPTARVRSV